MEPSSTSTGLKIKLTLNKRRPEDEKDSPATLKKGKKSSSGDQYTGYEGEEALGESESETDNAIALPKKATLRMGSSTSGTTGTSIAEKRDFTNLELKPDHMSRPLWVCGDGHIFLETFNPIYRQAYDFLVAIAEPECRSHLVHEYQLTAYSLYAAVSIGLSTEDIITVLNRLSKVKLPDKIAAFIRECTVSYGKVKLVLQRNRYFVESLYPDVLQTLLKDPVIAAARVKHQLDASTIIDPNTGLIVGRTLTSMQIAGGIVAQAGAVDPKLANDDLGAKLALDDDDDDLASVNNPDPDNNNGSNTQQVHSFEIETASTEQVKKRCIELDYPMLEEYDFRNDTQIPNLAIELKPTAKVRSYQEKSLSKMFGNGRARSGIIVLPCGAGKTLVGITSACTIKKSTLVLCTSSVSVEQWRYQFKLWSTVADKNIARFTSDQKESLVTSEAGVVVTTYTMIAFGGKRSKDSLKIMNELQQREWGLVLLDEVHVVPAHMFRKVLTVTKAHCKLGLTATLVREDDRIGDLNFLIGPKLYEANWIDLQRAGHIASVQCIEVWCSMAPEFYHEYLTTDSLARRSLLAVMNPIKFRHTQFLIRYHEQRGDKIIVFSDNIFALKHYATALERPYIYGPTSQTERMRILSQFQHNPRLKTIFISKVGDTSIDLPEANVIIQISAHYGSRRQEAQRLGRILRPKARTEGDEFNAFFYTLVSKDTNEMFYSTKRQQFLIDQGYAYKVISDLPTQGEQLLYSTTKEQVDLLSKVLAADESEGKEEELEDDFDDLERHSAAARRTTSTGRALSGGGGTVYMEVRGKGQDRARAGNLSIFKPAPLRNKIFKDRFNKKK